MTTTPAPSPQAQPEPATRKERLLRLLPDEIVANTRQLVPGQSNLTLAQDSLRAFGETLTQADLDAEARRRTQANRDPQAEPAPGAFGAAGRAEAARRFGKGTHP